jgi:hypothetical protein
MKLPNTTNSLHLNAFKKGYRLALDKKKLTSMPSTIKIDSQLSTYFEQGWQQSQDDQQQAIYEANKPQWNKRFVWLIIIILGGLATAYSMIYNYKKEQAQTKNNIPKTANKPKNISLAELSLLSPAARQDLTLTKLAQHNKTTIDTHSTVISSEVKFNNPQLTDKQKNLLNWQKILPKYIKQIIFKINLNKPVKNFKIQWFYQDKLIQEEKINGKNKAINSTIKLASGWAGKWTIQITNSNNRPVFRKHFTYIK